MYSRGMAAFTVVVVFSAIFGLCRGFPSGAPRTACDSMSPRHGYRNTAQDHRRNPSPYVISIENNVDTYRPGQTIDLSIHSTTTDLIKGFILEARTISGETSGPVGLFKDEHKGTQAICEDKALTHHRIWRVSGNRFKATWVAPYSDIGELVFVATVVQSYSVFWKNVRSVVLNPYRAPTLAPTTVTEQPAVVKSALGMCNVSSLAPLPDERPHVAILCDAHEQCPCGWSCCQSCTDNVCAGHAICRQPLKVEVEAAPLVAVEVQKQQSEGVNTRRSQEYTYSYSRNRRRPGQSYQ